MSFATPQEAAALVTVAVDGGIADVVPAVWSVPEDFGPLAVVLAFSGLVGSAILDRLRGDESDGGSDDEALMDDGLGGGLDGDVGGLDDGGDDLDGVGDWGGEDDPFGEMDGGESGDIDELERRIDELEEEVSRLSSTVGTVRSENEEVANQVEQVGENVRKLLDIYEMVTRGVNPLVDEGAGAGDVGGAGAGVDGSVGLFDDDGEEGSEEELDDDIANADSSEFFDEDLAEEDPESADPAGGLDGEFEEEVTSDGDGAFDGELNGLDDGSEDPDEVTSENEGEGSFAELGAGYESGDADWAGEDETTEASSAMPEVETDETGPLDGFEEGTDGADADPLDAVDEDGTGASAGEAEERVTEPDPGPDATGKEHDDVDDDWTVSEEEEESGFEFVEEPEDGSDRPFLWTLPGAYVGDLVVMEWLEFLVAESDPTDAARAIRYYETVDWISEDVKEDLLDFLAGFGEVEEAEALVPGTAELTRSHHTRSLSYINRLDDSDAESLVVDRWDEFSGGQDGV
jgi:flagellar protein FlaE/flagellar protein FlaC